MQTLPSYVIIASIGAFIEVVGLVVLIAVFTLLRGPADRRPYFKAWEESWVMLAVAMTAGMIYQRLTDPGSVLYASSRLTTLAFAAAYFAFRVNSLAILVRGARILVNGGRERWFVNLAIPAGLALSLTTDTFTAPLGHMAVALGPVAIATYAYVALLFATLPASRRSAGSRMATLALGLLTALWTGLSAYYLLARGGSGIAALPWVVRFERYNFYLDLVLQFCLAYAMVRLLLEDGRRDDDDTKAQLKITRNREQAGELCDEQTGLLDRRAFEASVGLSFAMASFGSVVRVTIANVDSAISAHGASVADVMVKQIGGLLAGSVRAHDRVYRWAPNEFLIVMPRAVPKVAATRIQFHLTRAASITVSGSRTTLRAATTVSAEPFSGAEDIAEAVRRVTAGEPPGGQVP